MRHAVDHAALAAAGYFTEWSVPAGSPAGFHLSTRDPGAAVRLIRLDRQDRSAVDWRVARTAAPLETQQLDRGAWLALTIAAGTLAAEDWSLELEFRLSVDARGRTLIATADFAVGFDAAGCLAAAPATAGEPLPLGTWVTLRLERKTSGLALSVRRHGQAEILLALETACVAPAPTEIRIGAGFTETQPTLNAGIGRLTVWSRGCLAAAWRFPATGRPDSLAPCDGDGAVLRIHNAPTFAMPSARWDGSATDPRQAPDHYDAVILHDDDLADAGWPVTHEIAVPEDAESGIYGLEVTAASETTRWPLFVTPRRRTADLVFLVPTFTYLAYAAERLPKDLFPWLCDDAGHRFAQANGLTSLYDLHNDGSGVTLAGRRRPLATIRDDYLYPLCGAPHLLPVDLHLLRFLDAAGIAVDIVTDDELHRDGMSRLDGYRGLITGSHPEYWSGAMLDALNAFHHVGGHIAYLGGNGGYWVTASDGRTIEVRRGMSGIRTWSSGIGETHLATTGEAGGLWRSRGRAEHRLLGVGLAAMGFTHALPYRRAPQSHAPALAWLFDGVGDAPIGSTGLVLGGAAGYEVDARSQRWGTPTETILLAVAQGFDRGYTRDETADEMEAPRGEMTLVQQPDGGMVFAVGSVSWCGALPDAGEMNPVGRITLNLLHAFLD